MGIQINLGKTKVWNGAAIKPRTCTSLELRFGKAKLEERCLGVGRASRAQHFRPEVACRQRGVPFAIASPNPSGAGYTMRLVAPSDVCWPRANHILRNLPPSEPSEFGQHHHNHLRACLADIIAMAVPDGVTTEMVQLPFRGPIGTSGPLGVLGRMFVPTASPRVGRAAVTSIVRSGNPRRYRYARSRRHGGARMVQIFGP